MIYEIPIANSCADEYLNHVNGCFLVFWLFYGSFRQKKTFPFWKGFYRFGMTKQIINN